eukprot:6467669-Amphidinium_carterae.1
MPSRMAPPVPSSHTPADAMALPSAPPGLAYRLRAPSCGDRLGAHVCSLSEAVRGAQNYSITGSRPIAPRSIACGYQPPRGRRSGCQQSARHERI